MYLESVYAEPTGLMIDSAMKVILSCIPEVSVEEKRQALDRASRYALMNGVTTVVDVGRYFPGAPLEHSWEDFSGLIYCLQYHSYLYTSIDQVLTFLDNLQMFTNGLIYQEK